MSSTRDTTDRTPTAQAREGIAPSTAVRVHGVGDEARWAEGLSTRYVRAGQRAFDVQVVLPSVKRQPITRTLAPNVLAHLS